MDRFLYDRDLGHERVKIYMVFFSAAIPPTPATIPPEEKLANNSYFRIV